MKLNTYLNFGGNCTEAFHFYEAHLGAKNLTISTFADMPEPRIIPPGLDDTGVLHASTLIGETMLMASDTSPERYQPMRSAYLCLGIDSNEEAERIYALLSEGGEIFMNMEETFFAHRFAMLRDRFGTSWMLIHEKPMPGNG
jgi:PhnB protein